jgi:mannose-6-phosphate isomerase-like protein (cupin superfamily)
VPLKMKKTFLMFVSLIMAIAAVPAGYDHWTAEQFKTREEVLHKTLKNGLASETLGHWGNHLLLKTRREASSGQAEWHEKQADLIVVQSGQATIVIGGTIVNGKTTAANEIRGTSIEGGERQALKAGDIVHVPAKIPHQVLLDAGQTLDYVVLKVDSQ